MKIIHYIRYYTLALALILSASSCKKLIATDPPRTQLIKATVFEDAATAQSAVAALYIQFSNQAAPAGMIPLTCLSADEMMVTEGQVFLPFYQNQLFSTHETINSLWRDTYSAIVRANAVIEGVQASDKLTTALKNQLLGEAKFFRAFYHFYLVNLFGDVPYITSTDYQVNGLVSRLPSADVYEKIKTDLLDAKGLLASDYSYSKGEKVRVNKWAAGALLARVYLYTGNWGQAETQADEVIGNTTLFGMTRNPDSVFLKNSSEAILQLIPPGVQLYTPEGGFFNKEGYTSDMATITDGLYNAFETNDARLAKWIGTGTSSSISWHYAVKYKQTYRNATGAEYSMILRLAEQYLIRAEARAQQNKLPDAAADINVIRRRAGLPNTLASTQTGLLDAVAQERRVELFTEWGHRWLDLKRTGKADALLAPVKPKWKASAALYPIPYAELQLNPNLKQNPNY